MGKEHQPSLFDSVDAPRTAPSSVRAGVVVREVRCRTLLNRCSIDDYSFNCYTGCEHGCGYCYARFMQRFHPHAEAWGQFVDMNVNAPEALARQLRRLPPGDVFTCSPCHLQDEPAQAGFACPRSARRCPFVRAALPGPDVAHRALRAAKTPMVDVW
jgi:hypothetical protein